MNVNPKVVKPAACLMLSLTFAACKKNSNNNIPAKAVTCTLVSVTDSTALTKNTYSITRDAIGRISSITTMMGVRVMNQRTFLYNSNRITIENKDMNGLMELDTLYVNNAGNVTYVKGKYLRDSSLNYIQTMQYDVSNKLTRYTENGLTTLCNWQNGDLTTTVDDSITEQYTYSNQPFTLEDGMNIRTLLQIGQPLYKTAHLSAGIEVNKYGINYEYNYEFDSNENVSKLTTFYNGSFNRNYRFGYDCH